MFPKKMAKKYFYAICYIPDALCFSNISHSFIQSVTLFSNYLLSISGVHRYSRAKSLEVNKLSNVLPYWIFTLINRK